MKNTETAHSSKRVQETRLRILQAASEEFSALGYNGATTRAIAARAGTSELTLFRHFQSKRNLFLQVIAHYSAIPEIQNTLQGDISGDIQRDLRQIARHSLKIFQARRSQIIMTLHEARLNPELQQVAANMLQHQKAILAAYLEDQIQQGKLRPCDPLLAAGALLGMLFSYAIEKPLSAESTKISDESMADKLVEIFLNGLTRL